MPAKVVNIVERSGAAGFSVERGVPMRAKGGGPRLSKYPWIAMGVGDSFFVPSGKVTTICAAASASGRRTGRMYTVRTVEGGVRVWRIA